MPCIVSPGVELPGRVLATKSGHMGSSLVIKFFKAAPAPPVRALCSSFLQDLESELNAPTPGPSCLREVSQLGCAVGSGRPPKYQGMSALPAGNVRAFVPV